MHQRQLTGRLRHNVLELQQAGFAPDYVEIRRSTDLIKATETDKDIAIFGAARLGTTRLIDNIALSTG